MSQILTQSDLLNADRSHWMFRDCVLWLPMQEGAGGTAYDISGRQNHGTLTNMDPSTDWVVGERGGRALDFDGSNDYVALGTPSVLTDTFSNSNLFSICGWFKTTATLSQIVGMIENTGSPQGSGNDYIRVRTNSSGKLTFEFDTLNDATAISSSGAANDGNWHQFCAVRTAANSGELFLDGVSQGTDTSASGGSGIDALSEISIGRFNNNVNMTYFTGQVGNIQFFSRALSSLEARTLYRDPWQPFARRKTFGFLPGAAPPSFKPWLAARRTASIIGGGI